MSTRTELIVAIIDKTANPINQARGAAAIHDQFNTDKTGFSLITQTAQTTAAVASVISVTQFTVGAVPFINITTNTLAGTVTFLKIIADLKSGSKVDKGDKGDKGDIVSLAGNTIGIVASFAILAGPLPALLATGFTVAATAATSYGIYNSDLAKSIHDKITPILKNLLTYDTPQGVNVSLVAPDLTFSPPSKIASNYKNLITTINWNSETSEVTLGTKVLDFPSIAPPPQTSGTESTSPAPAISPSAPPSMGSANSISPPTIPPDDATLTMSIESLNGVLSPDPKPSITVPIDEPQDSYACCGATQ